MKVVRTVLPAVLLLIILSAFMQGANRPAVFAASPGSVTPSGQSSQAQPLPCTQFTPGLNLRTLSDRQLMSLGLPTHVVLDTNLAYWHTYSARMPKHVCAKARRSNIQLRHTLTQTGSPQAPGDGCNKQPGTLCQSSHWAGKVRVSSDGQGDRGIYQQSILDFNMPSMNTNDSQAAVGVWTGLGGLSSVAGTSQGLVQAGADRLAFGNTPYLSWIEALNSDGHDTGTINLPLCGLTAGDHVEVYVESNLNGSGYDYFLINNYTENCSNSCFLHTNNANIHDTCGASGGTFYNSDSATGECIVERISLGNSLLDMGEFNPPGHRLTVWNCAVNGTNMGQQSYQTIIIVNASGKHLVDAGNLSPSGDSFTFYWDGSVT